MAELKPRLKRFTPSMKCQTCKLSIANKKLHQDLLDSTYFNEDGLLSVSMVMKKHKLKVPYRNVQNHMQHHLAPVKRYNDEKKVEVSDISKEEIAKAIAMPTAETAYEAALDETISKFHKELREGRLKLTVNTGLQAIKIKADMENRNKDRKLDFLKAFSAMGQDNGGTVPD